MKHIMLAIPAYTGVVHLLTMRSIISDLMALARRGDLVTIEDECGQGVIADCRARIVSRFLESSCTDLVFIDWDVVWPAGSVRRLVDHPVDVVGGIYPKRKDPIEFVVRPISDLAPHPETGLIEVGGVHGGFLKVSRSAAERMVASYSRLMWEQNGERVCGLFDDYFIHEGNGRRKLGEDYAFCQRWRDIGGKVWLDASFRMGHIGLKTFSGSLSDWLDQQKGTT